MKININNIEDIHNLIKTRRTELKYSQSEVAEKLNINQAPYCNKENMNFTFKLDELIQLGDILDFNIFIDNKEIHQEQDFLDMLIEVRKQNKVSQNVASQIAGLKSHPAYNQKELGKTSFKMNELINLCRHFNIGIDININHTEGAGEVGK